MITGTIALALLGLAWACVGCALCVAAWCSARAQAPEHNAYRRVN
jgi:hypothetical protein